MTPARPEVVVEVEGRRVVLSTLHRVLWPGTGFTKGEMIDYYVQIAPLMVAHIARHPMTLKRYPNGVEDKFWFQKTCRGHPDWIQTKTVPSVLIAEKNLDYCLIDSLPALVWAANLSTIEFHPLLATAEDVTCPRVVAFDLDPGPPAGLRDACEIALELRGLLAGIGLRSHPKTSGSKGLHVYVPLNTPHTYDQTKLFARSVAAVLREHRPERVVDRMDKALRAGKVFIDWSQNDPTKTTVAAYSVRAKARPTVSTPVTWDEVEAALAEQRPDALDFDATTVPQRVAEHGDLFADVLNLEQRLPRPSAAADGL